MILYWLFEFELDATVVVDLYLDFLEHAADQHQAH